MQLHNDYTKGRNSYPSDLVNAFQMLNNYLESRVVCFSGLTLKYCGDLLDSALVGTASKKI